VIDLKEEFILRKVKVYLLSREKKEEREFIQEQMRKEYSTIKVITDYAGILHRKEEWKKEDVTRLLVS